MNKQRESIEQATSLLADFASIEWANLPSAVVCELLELVERAGRFIDAARVQVAAEVADRSRFELGSDGLSARHGHRKPVHLVEQRTRVSQAEAARRIRLGSTIRPRTLLNGQQVPADFPLVAQALVEGEVGLDAAAVIIRCLSHQCRQRCASLFGASSRTARRNPADPHD